MANAIPPWVDAILVKLIKDYVPASAIADALVTAKTHVAAWLKAKAAQTATGIDDAIVDVVADALTTCSPNAEFLCALIDQGEAAAVVALKTLAAMTGSKVDDALVELVAKALGVPTH